MSDQTNHSKPLEGASRQPADETAAHTKFELTAHAAKIMRECGPQAFKASTLTADHVNAAGIEKDGSINFDPKSIKPQSFEKPLKQRLADGRYPRVGEAWRDADAVPGEDTETTMAKHDLVFGDATRNFGLQWKKTQNGDQSAQLDPQSIEQAKAMRARLLAKNPNMVLMAEVRYNDAKPSTFSADSCNWQHDANGDRIPNPQYTKFDFLDFKNPQFQQHVADQAKALVKSGAVDGVLLDWWNNGKDTAEDKTAKLQLLQKVRNAVGPDALIMANTNQQTMPEFMGPQLKNGDTATPLLNGYYMESFNKQDNKNKENDQPWAKQDYKQVENTFKYAEQNTREPRINFAETWWEKGNPQQREELPKMRATTTLAMTHSDGFSLFADPDNNGVTPDHSHKWYQFYNADVGKPLSKGSAQPDGSYQREFQKGTVVSNATGDLPVTVTFPTPRIAASELNEQYPPQARKTFQVNPQDGDIFLTPEN